MYNLHSSIQDHRVLKAYKEWKKLKNAEDLSDARYEMICRFVLGVPELDESMRKDLAVIMLGDDFCFHHKKKMPLPLNLATIDFYLKIFREKGLELDRKKLTLHLISLDITHVMITREPDDYKIDFSDYSTQIDLYFDEHLRTIQSHYGHVHEARRYFPDMEQESQVYREGGAQILEDYELKEILGQGGQKIAYEVLQHSTKQNLALKELRLNTESARASFHEEALLQARLSHPNIPPVFSLSLDEKKNEKNTPLVMVERLIVGNNWGSIIDDRDLEKNLETLITVSKTIAYVHQKSVIHGDLKPENIMLGKEDLYNEIYIVDWGLALDLVKYQKQKKLGILGECCRGGTYAYMPPELLSDRTFLISKASDVFMLGGILCRILTGRTPREDECYVCSPSELVPIILNVPISDLVIPNGKMVPEELVAIAQKALQHDPQNRYPDAEAFVQALERYRNHHELRKRLDRAKEVQKSYLPESNNEDPDRVYSASKILELIENTNEFRLIRESLEAMDLPKEDESPLPEEMDLLKRAICSETSARAFLVESALRSKDYTLAAAQLKIADSLTASNYKGDQEKTRWGEFHRRLDRGLLGQRRDRIMKWIATSALFLMLCSLIGVFYLSSENVKKENKIFENNLKSEQVLSQYKEDSATRETDLANNHIRYIMNLSAQNTEKENFHQGSMVFYNEMKKISKKDPFMINLLDIASKTSILLDKASGHRFITDAIAFSNDGKYFATLNNNTDVVIWNADTLSSKVSIPIRCSNDTISYLEPNPLFKSEKSGKRESSSRFVLYNTSGLILFISQNEKRTSSINLKEIQEISDNDFSHTVRPVWTQRDGSGKSAVIIASDAGTISTFSFPDGKRIHSFSSGQEGIKRLALSKDHRFLLATGKDGKIKQYTREGKLVGTFDFGFSQNEDHYVRRFAFSPSGNYIAAGCETGEIAVWNVAENRIIAKMSEPDIPGTLGNDIHCFYWLDEDRVLSLCLNNDYTVWDLKKIGKDLCPKKFLMKSDQIAIASGPCVSAISFKRDKLLVAGNDHTLRLFDTKTGKQIAKTEGISKCAVSSLTVSQADYFSPADRILVGNYNYHSLISIDPQTLEPDRVYVPYKDLNYRDFGNLKNLVHSLACPEQGNEFAAVFSSGDIMIFDKNQSEPKQCLHKIFDPIKKLSNEAYMIAADPKGSLLAATSIKTDEIILWDWKTRKELRRWKKTPPGNKNTSLDKKNDMFDKLNTVPSSVLPKIFLSIKDQNSNKYERKKQQDLLKAQTRFLKFIDKDRILELTMFGVLKIWNTKDGSLIKSGFVGQNSGSDEKEPIFIKQCKLSNDRKKTAMGFSNGLFQIINLEDFSVQYTSDRLGSPLAVFHPSRDLNGDKGFTLQKYNDITRFSSKDSITDIAWSKNDAMISLSFTNGKVLLLETQYFTKIASLACGVNDHNPASNLSINLFFSMDKLYTIGNDAVIRSWNYLPSLEECKNVNSKRCSSLTLANDPGILVQSYGSNFKEDTADVCKNDKILYSMPISKSVLRFEPQPTQNLFIGIDAYGKNHSIQVLNQKDGSSVNYPAITNAKGFPPEGFSEIACSSDFKTIAAICKEGNDVYLLDLTQAKTSWKAVMSMESDQEKHFAQLAFSTDSKILAAVDQYGIIHAWNIKDQKELKGEGPSLQGPMIDSNQGRIRFLSENLLLHCGAGNRVLVWDLKSFSLIQNINVPILEQFIYDFNSLNGLEVLNKGIWKDKPKTFVVAGNDEVVRFYQYSEYSRQFEPLYVISPLTLKKVNHVRGSNSDEESEKKRQRTRTLLADTFENNEKMYWNEQLSSEQSFINDLELSDDGRTLYIGTSDGVRSYDMAEVQCNIKKLQEKWENRSIDTLTGLYYVKGKGLFPLIRNQMKQRTNEKK